MSIITEIKDFFRAYITEGKVPTDTELTPAEIEFLKGLKKKDDTEKLENNMRGIKAEVNEKVAQKDAAKKAKNKDESFREKGG